MELLDISDVADRLSVTERFVRRLVAERRIPYLKIGKYVRFDPDDLDAWLDQRRFRPKSETPRPLVDRD